MKLLLRYPLVAGTIAALLAVLVLLLSGQPLIAQITASVYALAVAAYLAVGMVRRLAGGQWGIDILAVTAIVSTVLVGEFIASMIIVLMLAGGTALEDYAAGRAKKELTSLLERVPQTAHRERTGSSAAGNPNTPEPNRRDGHPGKRPARGRCRHRRPVGDILLVRPGEVVPLDGILLSESGTFDESSLTGESLPVDRVAGDALMSGSLNGEAAVRMQVTALMEDSQYSRIVALVKEASESKAPMVRLADRYAVPFTALAYALGAVGWIISGDPARFAEVLVVATPCPLLIAAPVAFLGGMSRAARGRHHRQVRRRPGATEPDQDGRLRQDGHADLRPARPGRCPDVRVPDRGRGPGPGGLGRTVFLPCARRLGDGRGAEPGPGLPDRNGSQ